MAKIRYKNVNGGWTQISASDIGAASDDLIARGVGKPIISDVQTNIKNDTVLYIDQNDYDGDRTTITKLNTQSLETPISIENGGTGQDTLSKARELFATSKEEIFEYVQPKLLDWVYPVGSIYISVVNESPAVFLGGTWEPLKDRFLLGAGTTYTAGSSGGKGDFIISAEEVPVQAHTHTPGTYIGPNHRHGYGDYKGPSHNHGRGTYYMPNHDHQLMQRDNSGTSTGWSIPTQNDKYKYTNAKVGNTGGSTFYIGGVSANAGAGSVTGNSGYAGTGAITGNSGSTSKAATVTHVNMPPYITVYMWKRTG